jgi:hydrogenase maturation protease
MVSVHSILQVANGEFVSLLDPPGAFKAAAAACNNVGTWPVLAGAEGQRDLVLSAPIILYDYPQVAPESAGDLSTAIEIDEILALRILTMTDAEKLEVRNGDDRARRILERTEMLPPEHFRNCMGLCAVCEIRGRVMNQWEWELLEDKPSIESIVAGGIVFRKGDVSA